MQQIVRPKDWHTNGCTVKRLVVLSIDRSHYQLCNMIHDHAKEPLNDLTTEIR